MSIISQSPRTRHQTSQLAAKIARQASKPVATPVNRVFGAGLFAPMVAPMVATPATLADCGEFSPSPRRSINLNVTQADRTEWASVSAEIETRRLNREIMAEFRMAEEQFSVIQNLLANDLAWADNEAMEAQRFASYGW